MKLKVTYQQILLSDYNSGVIFTGERYHPEKTFTIQVTDDSVSEPPSDSSENSPAQESQKASPLQDEMRAVYQYIQQQNPLPDMNFTYTANAKGENYAILSETTEEKDGTTVNVNYCLYDNGSKTDENNNTFEELVLEKVYPDGGYETELVDFYSGKFGDFGKL